MKKSDGFVEVLYFCWRPRRGPLFEPRALEQNQSSGLETHNLAQLRTLLVARCAEREGV
jgi:hypothetical protein